MVLLRSFLFTLLLFISAEVFSQKINVQVYMLHPKAKPGSDTIYHDMVRPLIWSDFQGKPAHGHSAGAVVSSGIAFNSSSNYDGRTLELKVYVYTYFSKKNSWKKADVNSAYHLLHEQRHFDITRIGAEKLVDEIRKASFTIANYNTKLNQIFNKVYTENNIMQNQYDRETRHSINVEKQHEWNDKIAIALSAINNNVTVKNKEE